MSLLLLKNLAKYVAKILTIVVTILLLVVATQGQKRSKSSGFKAKKPIASKSQKHVKPKPKARKKHVESKKVETSVSKPKPVPPPTHAELYPDESSKDAKVEDILLGDIFNGGKLLYRNAGGIFSMGWDLGTIFYAPQNRGKLVLQGCFSMSYCVHHRVAYFFRQIPCTEEIMR